MKFTFLNHCAISTLSPFSYDTMNSFMQDHRDLGGLVFAKHGNPLEKLRTLSGSLLQTDPDNCAFVRNTSEAINMIANGYPFTEGDEILSFEHEYPANHYPWRLQAKRGAVLKLIPAVQTGVFAADDLLAGITQRTRIIALSHVQFTSGLTADLDLLGNICKEKNIDLIIDAAQSLGSIPIYPEKHGIAAVATSGWKWLLGPIGSGLLYTTSQLREKLSITMTGSDLMKQGQDYLNHEWDPHTDGRMFEYSTAPVSHVVGLSASIENHHLETGIESVYANLIQLQDHFLKIMNESYDLNDKNSPIHLALSPSNMKLRSGILSLKFKVKEPADIMNRLQEKGIVTSARADYLRIAPHYYNQYSDIEMTAELIKQWV